LDQIEGTTVTARGPVVAMLVPGGLEHSGGIGRWAGYLLDAWTAEGTGRPEIIVVETRGRGGKLAGILAFPLGLLRLGILLLSGRLALIHVNLSSRGSTVRKCVVVYAAALFGVPTIIHLHGSGFDQFYLRLHPRFQRIVGGMFARARTILVLGEVWRRFLVEQVGVDPGKITILYNGVPKPRRLSVPVAGEPCRIVMLGRLEPRKGVPELLAALGSDSLKARAWRAVLAGDGDVEGTRQRAAALGLADRIEVPGWIAAERAEALLEAADILVLASHAENMPMSVLEALAHRVAVVTTPVGTTPEILQDGVSALFAPPGDIAALAEALARLIDQPTLRAEIAAGGQAVFRRDLDIALSADRLTALYRATAPALGAPDGIGKAAGSPDLQEPGTRA